MGCGVQYVGEISQTLKGRSRSHSLKNRKYSSHFIKYNHSIENVKITQVEILSKQPVESRKDRKTQIFS